MLRYELKKIVNSRTVFFFVTFFMIFNAIVIFKTNYKTDVIYVEQLELYDEIQNMSIEESIKYIEGKISNNGLGQEDSFLQMQSYEALESEIEGLREYKDFCNRLSSDSMNLAENFKESSRYLYRLNIDIASRLASRSISRICNVDKYKELFDYRLSYIFVLLSIVIGISGIFSLEKELKTYGFIKSSVNGQGRIVIIKVVAAMLYALGINLLFAANNYACFWMCYRFNGIDAPVYQINDYHGEAFNTLTNDLIYSFLLKCFCISSLGILTITMIVILFSLVVKDKKLTFWISTFCIIGFIILRSFCAVGIGKTINLFNPINLLLVDKTILYFETFNFGGEIIYGEYLSSIIIFAELIIILIFVYMIYRNNGICLMRRGKNVKKRSIQNMV